MAVVDDQRGSPTFVGHLAEATKEVLELPHGTYHVAAAGECTWAEFAEAIFEEAGLDCRVRRITTAELGRPAPRPANSVLRSERGAPRAPALARGPSCLPSPSLKAKSWDQVPGRVPAGDMSWDHGPGTWLLAPGGFFDLERARGAAPTRRGSPRTTRPSLAGRPRTRSPAPSRARDGASRSRAGSAGRDRAGRARSSSATPASRSARARGRRSPRSTPRRPSRRCTSPPARRARERASIARQWSRTCSHSRLFCVDAYIGSGRSSSAFVTKSGITFSGNWNGP